MLNLKLFPRPPTPDPPHPQLNNTHSLTYKLPSTCVPSLSRHTHVAPSLQVYTHTHSHTFLPVPAWLLPLAFPWPSSRGHVLQLNVKVQLLPLLSAREPALTP